MNKENELLTPKELTTALKICKPTYHKLLRDGMPFVRVSGNYRIVRRYELSKVLSWFQTLKPKPRRGRPHNAQLMGSVKTSNHRGAFESNEVPTPLLLNLRPTYTKDPRFPDKPGVYFGWIGTEVVYVGQSISLQSRITYSHSALVHCDGISWVELPAPELNWMECYYIGRLRPKFNFGGIPGKEVD